MPRLVFLGTGAAVPSKEDIRFDSATWLSYGKKCNILIDGGEGTKYALLHAGVSRNLHHIFLTHDHYDHIMGLTGLLAMISLTIKDVPPITIYGPLPALHRAETLVGLIRSKAGEIPSISIDYRSLGFDEIVDLESASVQVFETRHRELPSFGYIFTSTDGNANHKTVFTGDTVILPSFAKTAKSATWLVANTNFTDDDDRAARNGHMTVLQAAKLAQEAGVERLYMQHLSPRHSKERDTIITAARAIFLESYWAEDLMVVQ